jgi:hypothetical protein
MQTTLPNLYTPESDAGEYPCTCHSHTPLDGLETSELGNATLGEIFRHSGWRRLRSKVHDALIRTEQPAAAVCAFRYCGSECWVLRSKTTPTDVKLAASCCHNRFCLPCANARAATIARNVTAYLHGASIRFITLTLKQNEDTLTNNIEKLYESFKKLRKTSLWKTTQRGGVGFLEVKRSRDRQHWHAHLHVISQGKFIDGQKLSWTWRNITTDSYIVDVRLVHSPHQVLQYVTKYASKPFDPTMFEDPDTLDEAILALKGKRMALTYGNWKGLQMTETPDKDAWEFLDTLEGIARKAAEGDAAALVILQKVCGDRTEWFLAKVARDVVPRMNPTRPPTPDVELYLIGDAPSCGY